MAALIETFPEVRLAEVLFTLDETRFSCCGGVAGLDLALAIIRKQLGIEIANMAARYVFHQAIRGKNAVQQDYLHNPEGRFKPPKLSLALEIMEDNLDQPLPIGEIADRVGMSQRQLERIFASYSKLSPVRHYIELRLIYAQRLITQTDMQLIEVSIASGFSSHEHFSRVYKSRFGVAPSIGRRIGRVPFQFRSGEGGDIV